MGKFNMDTLYVVMPAYNEEACIEKVVLTWKEAVLNIANVRLVIADSGSTDNTHKILEELHKQYPQIEVLSDTGKYHGPKLIALYKYAIEHGADYIFQTDSDGQTNPGEFDIFWNNRDHYDAILGKRSVRDDGKLRKIVEDILCIILKIIFGIRISDANAPFRLIKSDLVKKYIGRFDNNYNLPNVMLTTFFVYYKENIVFKDISFGARRSGANSINLLKIIKIGIKAVGDFKSFKKRM